MRSESLRLIQYRNIAVFNPLNTSYPIKGRHMLLILTNHAFRMSMSIFKACLAALYIVSAFFALFVF